MSPDDAFTVSAIIGIAFAIGFYILMKLFIRLYQGKRPKDPNCGGCEPSPRKGVWRIAKPILFFIAFLCAFTAYKKIFTAETHRFLSEKKRISAPKEIPSPILSKVAVKKELFTLLKELLLKEHDGIISKEETTLLAKLQPNDESKYIMNELKKLFVKERKGIISKDDAAMLDEMRAVVRHVQLYMATVQRITSGDSVIVQTPDSKEIDIRLYGVEAPKLEHTGGAEAVAALAPIQGRQVLIIEMDAELNKQTVGVVMDGDRLINEWLVDEGRAWHYPQHCKEEWNCGPIKAAEESARIGKRGIWQNAQTRPLDDLLASKSDDAILEKEHKPLLFDDNGLVIANTVVDVFSDFLNNPTHMTSDVAYAVLLVSNEGIPDLDIYGALKTWPKEELMTLSLLLDVGFENAIRYRTDFIARGIPISRSLRRLSSEVMDLSGRTSYLEILNGRLGEDTQEDFGNGGDTEYIFYPDKGSPRIIHLDVETIGYTEDDVYGCQGRRLRLHMKDEKYVGKVQYLSECQIRSSPVCALADFSVFLEQYSALSKKGQSSCIKLPVERLHQNETFTDQESLEKYFFGAAGGEGKFIMSTSDFIDKNEVSYPFFSSNKFDSSSADNLQYNDIQKGKFGYQYQFYPDGSVIVVLVRGEDTYGYKYLKFEFTNEKKWALTGIALDESE